MIKIVTSSLLTLKIKINERQIIEENMREKGRFITAVYLTEASKTKDECTPIDRYRYITLAEYGVIYDLYIKKLNFAFSEFTSKRFKVYVV